VRYVRTDSFKADYKRLSEAEKAMFRKSVDEFNEACDRFVADNTPFPARLRVRDLEGAPGVLEMTWSFAGPDGRATWEWGTVDVVGADGNTVKERAVVWRRVGSHRIFGRP
jgi:hypothetical protein